MQRAIACAILAFAIGATTIHAVAWSIAARTILYEASPHVPRIQAVIVLGLGALAVQGASQRRRVRRLVVVAVLVGTLAALLAVPLPAPISAIR